MQPAALAASSRSEVCCGGSFTAAEASDGPLPSAVVSSSPPPRPTTSATTTAAIAARPSTTPPTSWRRFLPRPSCARPPRARAAPGGGAPSLPVDWLTDGGNVAATLRPPQRRAARLRRALGAAWAPAVVDELGDLVGESLRRHPQLHDRARLEQPRVGQLLGEQARVGERVDGVAVVPDHQRRRGERAPLGAVRRRPAGEDPLEHGGARRGLLADGVEQDVRRPRDARLRHHPRDASEPFISGSPAVSATISGVNATAQASSALSSTGISSTIPRSRSGASRRDLERGVRAQRRAADDRLVELEVVEQRRRRRWAKKPML